MSAKLRVAIVHSFYGSSQPSGENRVVEDQVAALADAGHEVLLVRRDTDEFDSQPGYAVRTATDLVLDRGFDPSRLLQNFQPDVIHVHNLFPNFGTQWMRVEIAPTVVSMHNYRLFCSNGLLFRDGNTCFECVGGSALPAVRHACYRHSRLATLPVALSRRTRRENILTGLDAVVTTSERSDSTLRTFLGDDIRMAMIPNFSSTPEGARSRPESPRRWLAMGRFSPEKGFRALLDIWPDSESLDLVGAGEQEADLRRAAGLSVTIRDAMPRAELRAFIPGHFGLIFPSRWLEADPQVVVEAVRLGLPVIAHESNSVADMIRAHGFGAIYRDAASLTTALRSVETDWASMSEASIATFRSRWSKAAWIASIETLYAEVIHEALRK